MSKLQKLLNSDTRETEASLKSRIIFLQEPTLLLHTKLYVRKVKTIKKWKKKKEAMILTIILTFFSQSEMQKMVEHLIMTPGWAGMAFFPHNTSTVIWN